MVVPERVLYGDDQDLTKQRNDNRLLETRRQTLRTDLAVCD